MHEDVVQMPMAHIYLTLLSLFQLPAMPSGGSSYDQLTGIEKTQVWFTDGPAQYAGTT